MINLRNFFSFSNERINNFIAFLKQASRFRYLCCWSNSLLKSIGSRDKTENFVWLRTNWFLIQLLLLNLVKYCCWISVNWFPKINGAIFVFMLNMKIKIWLILSLYIFRTFNLINISLLSLNSLFAIHNVCFCLLASSF